MITCQCRANAFTHQKTKTQKNCPENVIRNTFLNNIFRTAFEAAVLFSSYLSSIAMIISTLV